MLESMFEAPWTRDMLEAVLDYHEGKLDETISSLLIMNEHHKGNPAPLVEQLLLSNDRAYVQPGITPAPVLSQPISVIPPSLRKKAPPPRKSEVTVKLDGTDQTATITIQKSTRRRIGYPIKLPKTFLRLPKGWNAEKQARAKAGPLFAPNHLDHLIDMTPSDPLPTSPSSEETAEDSDVPDTHFKMLRTSINFPGFRKNSSEGDNSQREQDNGEKAMFGKFTAPNISVPHLNIPSINIPSIGQSNKSPEKSSGIINGETTGAKRWSLPNIPKNNSENKASSELSESPEKQGSRWSLNVIGSNIKTPPKLIKRASNQEKETAAVPTEQRSKPTRWSLPSISTTLKAPTSGHQNNDAAPLIRLDTYAPLSKVEYRGITVRQFQRLVQDMRHVCTAEEWELTDSSGTVTRVLKPEQVTMYDLTKHYVIPKTKDHSCSLVEEAFGKDQYETVSEASPRFFVSHYWGDSVLHLLRCIEQHALDQGLDLDKAKYWICAFAMNHHFPETSAESNDEELQDPWTILKVLKTTQGMISVVDSECTYFSRLWCLVEIFFSLRRRSPREEGKKKGDSHYKYEVYATNDEGRVVGLADGPAESDKYRVLSKENNSSPMNNSKVGALPLGKNQPCNPIEWSEHRALRQSEFPFESCIRALNVHIESAQTSLEGDVSRLLNCIAQYDKGDVHGFTTHSSEALTTHPTYTTLNQLIRGTFAGMIYRHALDAASDQQEGGDKQKLLEKVRTVLSASPMEYLEVTFAGCKAFQIREAMKFAEALPKSLRSVDLDYSFLDFQYAEEFAIQFGRLGENLESFKLNCAFCSNLSNLDRLWEELGQLVNLKQLVLVFHPNKNLTSIDGLSKAIRNMRDLCSLELEFDCYGNYSKMVAMAKGGATLTNFRNIMRQSSDASQRKREISRSFDKAPRLANLDLICTYISEASILGLLRTLSTRIHDGKLNSIKLRFLGDIGKKLKHIQTMDDLLQTLHRLDQGSTGTNLFHFTPHHS